MQQDKKRKKEYSNAMTERFDGSRPYGGRTEYSEQTLEDRLDECALITDVIDELFQSPLDSGGTVSSQIKSSSDGYAHFRSFQYMDIDTNSGLMWPIERTVDIRYTRPQAGVTNEQYYVLLGSRVLPGGISDTPLLNTFQITYYGPDRDSVIATIDEPDIIGEYDFNYNTRSTTSYDHHTLFDELGRLTDMLQAQERENTHLDKLSAQR